jgi:hypothetical protein
MQGTALAGKGSAQTQEEMRSTQPLMEDIMRFILQNPVYFRPTYGPVFTSVISVGLRKFAVRNSILHNI